MFKLREIQIILVKFLELFIPRAEGEQEMFKWFEFSQWG